MTAKVICIPLIFAVSAVVASAQPQSFTVLTTVEQGLAPTNNGAMVRDAAGNLFSASAFGGLQSCNQGEGCGFIYRVDPTGKFNVIYNFQGPPDGVNPEAPLVLDSAGNLYGVTVYGGAHNYGTIFKLDHAGNETVLYSFAGPSKDGENPYGGVIRDASGNLYGTTAQGGIGKCFGAGCGTVFKFSVTGKETVLYRFTGGADGSSPVSTLLLVGGVLYGTTVSGGNVKCQPPGNAVVGCGTVFKLEKGTETVLYTFNNGPDGGFPVAGVVSDAAGNLYGTTEDGGDLNCGCGVAYKVDTSGHETVLHTFKGLQDGEFLQSALVFDGTNLYGSTLIGGGIFRIDSSGNFAVVHPLSNQVGNGPSTMLRDDEGNLYGIFESGVFEFTP